MLGLPAMDAAQALLDLTEVSSQIEGAVLSDADGNVIASTFPEEAKGAGVAHAGLTLLAAAKEARRGAEGTALAQVHAATAAGSVFLVRDDRRTIVAVTRPEPTTGLIFYDLKTCLRLVGEGEAEKTSGQRPRRQTTKRATEPSARKRSPSTKKKASDA